MDLLEMIAEGLLPTHEVIEMIKRTHVANYEQAKPYVDSAVSQGEVEPNMLPGFYSQDQLISAIEWGKVQSED